ncbi:hypothetical protein [Methylomonas sp. AM2-LC]|uniref:hypothetical protein n=1 Tax=Methylomonas sp. AM2-LC TaxID=3153301 RepID=UPI003263E59F
MTSKFYEDTKVIVKDKLFEHGWGILKDLYLGETPLASIAQKSFETATGTKLATVYLLDLFKENIVAIHGEYQSQATNVLSTCNVFIKENSTANEVSNCVDDFLKNANHYIDESFSRRLFLKYGY